jgi:hypothetical protein
MTDVKPIRRMMMETKTLAAILVAISGTLAAPALANSIWDINLGLTMEYPDDCVKKSAGHVECYHGKESTDSIYMNIDLYLNAKSAGQTQERLAHIANNPTEKAKRLNDFRSFMKENATKGLSLIGDVSADIYKVGGVWTFVGGFQNKNEHGVLLDTAILEVWNNGSNETISVVARDDADAVAAMGTALATLAFNTDPHHPAGDNDFRDLLRKK